MAEKAFRIDEEWAMRIKHVHIFNHNQPSAEDLLSEVNVRSLGGLVVPLPVEDVVSYAEIREIMQRRSAVTLAFVQRAIMSDTELLLAAAFDQRGPEDELTLQLQHRNQPTDQHGSNETWFLPVAGVEIFDCIDAVR